VSEYTRKDAGGRPLFPQLGPPFAGHGQHATYFNAIRYGRERSTLELAPTCV
jgi:hypothetical protein